MTSTQRRELVKKFATHKIDFTWIILFILSRAGVCTRSQNLSGVPSSYRTLTSWPAVRHLLLSPISHLSLDRILSLEEDRVVSMRELRRVLRVPVPDCRELLRTFSSRESLLPD